MKLTMVGTGYVGLVTGVCLANTGNTVTCLDVDPRKIEKLRQNICPIYEPGLTELMVQNTRAGRLSYTLDKNEAYRDAEMVFICVGTPSGKDGKADLKYVMGAADDIADVLKALGPGQKPKTIVVKSTVPVGTSLKVRDRIRERVGPGIPFTMGNNPEFLKEGDAVSDFLKPDRVICGVEDHENPDNLSIKRFRTLYEPFVRNGHPIYIMDILSSEMVKYASNNFLATKISYINEMANLCERYGANINRVREGMCADKRIGTQFLYPGLGYGGSCFPKDTQAVVGMGDECGFEMQLSRSVHEVNQRQRKLFFDKIERHYAERGGLKGRTLAFWGIAFKPRTDDVREAPALDLMKWASERGATIRAYDPVAHETGAESLAQMGVKAQIVADAFECARGAHGLVVSTDWDEFKVPDWERLAGLLAEKTIFDGRNLYKRRELRQLGFNHHSVGRPSVIVG
ncbi:MAG: UDP-glucose/GDP-mannose dehydrogenase family protein [Phycisphaerales bacterium]|jgi:UDPglucose 6-dehydrogenase|nr:UDP-glucose/GDP-mannose dehydrogenase family protein [Phycisphaerales bacterium]